MKRNERRARLEVSAESGRVGTALCARAYSPKCLEEEFCELRLYRYLGKFATRKQRPSNTKNTPFGGCADAPLSSILEVL